MHAELLAGQPALEELLEHSRGWADQGLVRLVLVTSEDSFVKRLLGALSPEHALHMSYCSS